MGRKKIRARERGSGFRHFRDLPGSRRADLDWHGSRVVAVGWTRLEMVQGRLAVFDVSAIADDADGNLWVGTGGGLACLRDGKFTSFHKKDVLPSEEISSLLVDSDGVLWIGTRGGGLARLFKNQWTHYTTADGLAGNSIGYLIEDSETNLWLGSNTGLMRVEKKSLNDFANGAARDVSCRVRGE